ncbi:MAG: hypothetical protein FJ147_10585 [Deltaproteobacteria bacterium]|nr:hypothetical protein [Deltaproteobacteria bacterium]
MDNVDRTLIDAGVNAAKQRAQQDFAGGPPELPPTFIEAAERILKQWPHDLSPRFIKLVVELGAIAAMARIKYQHPPLTDDESFAFLGHCASFFNSFKHR